VSQTSHCCYCVTFEEILKLPYNITSQLIIALVVLVALAMHFPLFLVGRNGLKFLSFLNRTKTILGKFVLATSVQPNLSLC